MRYKAFISYSHSHRELARALQNSLHRFGTPWYERVGAKIFRDESGLAATQAQKALTLHQKSPQLRPEEVREAHRLVGR